MLELCTSKKTLSRLSLYLLVFSTLSTLVFSSTNIRSLQTTRLKSTAGTGVGSVLLDESSLLNPAPLAMFKSSAFYYQRSTTDTTLHNSEQSYDRPESEQTIAIASDAKGPLKGSISYQKSTQGYNYRKRFGASSAKALGKKSAIGATYLNTTDDLSEDGVKYQKKKFHQSIFGVIHAVEPNFTIGLTAIDPFKVIPEESKTLIGFQYVHKNMVSIMADAGADYESLSDSLLYRAAIQLKVLNDIFMRVGLYRDKTLRERGNGVGIGWVGPKLVLEAAYKNATFDEYTELNQLGSDIKETSFSLAYHW